MTLSGKRVLVLGGRGFIGSAVVKECQSAGIDVVAPGSSDVDLRSPAAVQTLSPLVSDDTILIALARARTEIDQWRMFQDNVALAATVGLLGAGRRLRKCVYCSSMSVYGDDVSNLAITEETPLAPSSPYGQAKLAGERIVQYGAEQSDTPMLTLRACMIYGPGDTTTAYGPSRLAREALTGRVSIIGDGSELRPYLFIDDVARIIVALAVGPYVGAFNISPDSSHSFMDVVNILCSVSARELEIMHLKRRRPRIDLMVDPAKMLAAAPIRVFTNLRQGLGEVCSVSGLAKGTG